jgi:hypothetical protein
VFSGAAPKAEWRRVQLRSILMRAREQALFLLKEDFGFAIHLCPIQRACEEIILRGELEPLLETAGPVFALLDYFLARATLPRRNEHTRLRASFFSGRQSFDFFHANGAQLLAFLGVLRAIPERWLPEGFLNADLPRRFEELQFPEKVAFEASPFPPMPGGIQWLKQKSLEHFAALERKCLVAPAPFVLLLREVRSHPGKHLRRQFVQPEKRG